jgi:hypothetical protein
MDKLENGGGGGVNKFAPFFFLLCVLIYCLRHTPPLFPKNAAHPSILPLNPGKREPKTAGCWRWLYRENWFQLAVDGKLAQIGIGFTHPILPSLLFLKTSQKKWPKSTRSSTYTQETPEKRPLAHRAWFFPLFSPFSDPFSSPFLVFG